MICCFGAAAIGLAIGLSGANPSLPTELWNAAGRLGVYLVFCALLRQVRQSSATHASSIRATQRLVLVSATAACALAAIGWVVQHHAFQPSIASKPASSSSTQPQQQVTLTELTSLTERCMRSSRPVLLGSRDPQGPSCVSVVRTGDLKDNKPPQNIGDLNGGPGTTMVALYCFNRAGSTSPLKDFEWHQTRLRTYLENLSALNQSAELLAHRWSARTREFAEMVDSWNEVPASFASPGERSSTAENWPEYCLVSLNRALASKDLLAAKRWSHELAAAALSLDDLHHWIELLTANHLRALDFQADCKSLFESAETQLSKYDPNATISMFPAGILSLNGWGNYYEVERQAEGLFANPPDLSTQPALSENITPVTVWLPPSLRGAFLKLQQSLSSSTNRASWEQAAQAPYEHSYLVGMLYRASRVDAMDGVAAVLKKFDAVHPQAKMGELLGVLMYRGHSFAGLEWADRFQPELLKAAEEIPPNLSDADALLAAADWTNKFYHGPSAAYGMTFTLRDALEQKKLDCVRATDMIGAIFRNSGRPRFGHVRWCAETNAHSVAAYLGRDGDKPKTLLEDGLSPSPQPEVWPDAYFHGHAWPAGLTPTPMPYCAELYVRGLDSYLWAEGYIIRGPNAGNLTTARIPYSTHRLEQSTTKVFDGPYPQP